jgi:hypothetical protein
MTSLPISNRFKMLLCVAVTHWLALSPFTPVSALPPDLDSPLVYTAWRSIGVPEGLPNDSIRSIRVVDDQVWVGTDSGISRLERGEWKSWTAADGLPPYPISAIDLDLETRDLWLATWGGGIVRFTAGRADSFNQFNSGLAGDLVFAVVVADGRVWAATNGGLSVFDPPADSWELYHPRQTDEPGTAVTDLLYDDGRLSTLLKEIDIGRFDLEPLLPLSTTTKVWRRNERTPREKDSRRGPTGRRSTRSGPVPGYVQCSALGPSGSLWVGTHEGLHALADRSSNQWITYHSEGNGRPGVITLAHGDVEHAELQDVPGIPDNNVRCIAFDHGDIWVGTERGLAHGRQPVSWRQADALSTNRRPPKIPSGGTAPDTAPPSLPASQSDSAAAPSAIAVYGPRNRTISLPGENPQGEAKGYGPDLFTIEMIVERASAPSSGQSTQPIELQHIKPGYSRYGWGLPEDDMIVFSQNPRVLGIIGAIGPEQLMTNAAAARTEVPWINVAPIDGFLTAPTGDLGGLDNPWVFQCWGDLPRQHRILLDHVFGRLGCSRPAALRTPGSGLHSDWWADVAHRRGHPLVADVEWESDATHSEATWEMLRGANADVVLTWCDKRTAAKMLRSMRQAGMQQWFVGGPAIVAEDFMTLVGGDPGPVIALMPQDSTAGGPSDDAPPDARASRSRLATEHLIDAIRRLAPDRPSVRRTLEEMSRSAWGEGHYERVHEKGNAIVARLEGGRWVTQTVFASPGD